MRWYPVLLLTGTAVAALPCPRDAWAADPQAANIAQARVLLNEGLALRDKGNLQEALDKLRAAHELIRTPITGVELGRAYMALGQLVEARETFLSVVRIPVTREETSRSATARGDSARLAEEILPRIPRLTVRIGGTQADSVKVTIDGAEIPAEALAAPRQLDPGQHDVTAKSEAGGDEATATLSVTLKEGESREVELKPEPPPRPVATRSQPVAPQGGAEASVGESPRGAPLATLGWSLLGAGAAVAAAGAVLMGVEVGPANRANEDHDAGAYDRARAGWTVGLVGALAGGTLAATGIVVLFVKPGRRDAAHAPASPWIGFTGRELRLGAAW